MADYTSYHFEIGKAFRQKQPSNIEEYLNTAKAAHGFFEPSKTATADGIYWKDQINVVNPDAKQTDLSSYVGSSGILYYYLELYRITGDETYKELVLKAADYLDAHWQDQIIASKESFDIEGVSDSIYIGIASLGMILSVVYKAFGREKDLNAIKAITEHVISDAGHNETGLYWSFDKSILLGGGTVLYLYKIYDLLKDDKVLDAANKGADAILSEAIKDPRGGYAWTSYAHPGQTRVPNFECGTAGVGYLFTVAYDQSGDERYLNAAKEAAKHLKAIAVPQGEGFLIPWHDNPDEETIFYVSTCHGPAGTSRLFYQLYKITNEQAYLDDIRGLYKGLRHIGVPERQSKGYWNTTCLCCGTAGVLQFLVNYSLIVGDEDVKNTAITAGNILLGEQRLHNKIKSVAWPVAFERIKPDNIAENITYGAGSAGISVALMQLYLLLKGEYKWDRLFDDPYPATV
jgi:lantibiotic modifying enzyme